MNNDSWYSSLDDYKLASGREDDRGYDDLSDDCDHENHKLCSDGSCDCDCHDVREDDGR